MTPAAAKPGQRESLSSLRKWIPLLALSGSLLALVVGSIFYWASTDLPTVAEIRRQIPDHNTSRGRTSWVPLKSISKKLQMAVIVSEDWSFYRHHGFDYDELQAAFLTDLQTRDFRRGGSTITQQVAKNLYLTPEKTLLRKFREAIVTWRLEHALSKDEILELYLNVADWGNGITGAQSAAHFYFAKPASELSWSEAALLAAMLPNPHRLNPFNAPKQTLCLRQIVLLKLLIHEDIQPREYREATSATLIHPPKL
jgi:monofunctional biosynthetic peptidoglycan transglycosylase